MAGSASSSWPQMPPSAPTWRRPPPISGGSEPQLEAAATMIKRLHRHRHKQRHWRRSRSESIDSIDIRAAIAGDNENSANDESGSSRGCIRWNYCTTGDDAHLSLVSARAVFQGQRRQQRQGPRSGADDQVATTPRAPMMATVTISPASLALSLARQQPRTGKRRTRRLACFLRSPTGARGALAMPSVLLVLLALALLSLFRPAGHSLAAAISSAQNDSGNNPGQQQLGSGGGANSNWQQQSSLPGSGPLSLANESQLVKAALSSVMSIEPISVLQSNSQQQEQQLQQRHQASPAVSSILNANLTGASGLQHQQHSNSSAVVAMIPIADEFSLQQQAIRANDNAGEEYSDLERYVTIGIIILDIMIFIVGFCGNTVVILLILKFTKVESVTDVYILNLAFADLMFLTGLLFLMITMFIGRWIFGPLMCKLYMATTSLNQFASSLLLVVMSFDRFLAVCHPFYAQRFRRLERAKVICLCIWVVCWILMTPILTFAKIDNSGMNEMTCTIIWPEYESINCDVAFTLYSFTIGFAGPLLLIAAFHVCVIRKLRLAASASHISASSSRLRTRESTNRRVEHLVIGIICTYTVCWLPYWVGQLGVSFTSPVNSPVQRFWCLYLVATSLEYFNSALNPILYAFLSDNFKRRCSDIVISCAKWWQFSRGAGCHYESEPSQHRGGASTTACYELEPSRVEIRSTSAALSRSLGSDGRAGGGGSSISEGASEANHQLRQLQRRPRRQSSPRSRTPFAAGGGNASETGADFASTSSSDCGCSGFGGCLSIASSNSNRLAKTSSNLAPANNAANSDASASADVILTSLSPRPAAPSALVAPPSPTDSSPTLPQREAAAGVMSPATPSRPSSSEFAAAGSGAGAKVQAEVEALDSSGDQRKKSVAFSSIDTVVVHGGKNSCTSSGGKNSLTI